MASAHLVLFHLIFKVTEEDTKFPMQPRHIHSAEFEIFSADAHKGQILDISLSLHYKKF